MSGLTDLLTGSIFSKNEDKKAQDNLGKVTGSFDGITPPTLSPLDLQKYSWQQDYNPAQVQQGADVQYDPVQAAQAQAAMQGQSNMSNISDDPRLRDQQDASLGALQDLANHGGMNLTDKANLQRVEDQVNQQDKGRQDAIMQNMAERGAGGSGNELLQRLTSSQSATDRASQQSMDVAGQAQQRALQAMMQGGQLAGQIRGQDFGEASQKAQAQDAIDRFNAQNATSNNQFNTNSANSMSEFNAGNTLRNAQQNRATDLGVQTENTNAINNGQKFNIEGRQGLTNANVDLGNRQTTYNQTQLPQQNFQNQTTLAKDKSGAAQAGVDYWGKQSAANRQGFQNLMSGGAQVASSMMSGGGGAGGSGAKGSKPSGSAGSDGSGDTSSDGSGDTSGDTSGGSGDTTGGNWHGGIVPGHAQVPGDSPMNDTRMAEVAPGEAIVPRSVTTSAHPVAAFKSFLRHAPTAHAKPIGPGDLGDFLHGLNPKKAMHQDSEFSLGDKSYNPESGESPNLDETVAKLAALGLLSK